jgi:hypothetical protein
MTRLSQGDRDGAKHHFRQAIETQSYSQITWTLSRLILARLEKDPGWPPWIPVRQ